jgi:hypothetical protein
VISHREIEVNPALCYVRSSQDFYLTVISHGDIGAGASGDLVSQLQGNRETKWSDAG